MATDKEFIVLGNLDYQQLEDAMNQYPDYQVGQIQLAAGSQYALVVLQKKNGGGGGGTTDYTALNNKPKINGVTLLGDKTASQLNLETDFAKKREEFIATYGGITLTTTAYSAWATWMADHPNAGIYYVLYDNNLMVQAFVTTNAEYPLQFIKDGRVYGKNSIGIKELTVNVQDVPQAVKTFLETGIVDGGSF